MPSTLRARRSSPLTTRRPRAESTAGYVAALVLLTAAPGLAASAGVSMLDGRRALLPLLVCAAACGVAGVALRRRCTAPRTLRIAAVHRSVLLGWTLLIAISTVAYLAAGTFDRLDLALFESTAGFTTTALSVLEPIEGTPKGVLFWRAFTQWTGGFAAVLVITAVLPLLGVGVEQEAVSASDRRRLPLRSPRLAAAARRLAAGYLLLSIVGVVLFALAGMGPFDAVTYAMTTISTGGFANHDASLGHFRSELVEWVAVGGMALGGISLVLVLAVARRQLSDVRRSVELRWYLAAMAVGSGVVVWLTADRHGLDHDSLRQAVFAAVSAASTTGHRVGGWSAWGGGPQIVLLLLAAVGCMAGAAGGGFRIPRAAMLLSFVRREVVRQLHPRSVQVVKIGQTPIGEGVVAHAVAFQFGWLLLALVGAVMLGLSGLDLVAAGTGAVSALATFGPALGLLTFGARDVGVPGLLVLAVLMLAGRLEISPLAVGITSLISRTHLPRIRGRRR